QRVQRIKRQLRSDRRMEPGADLGKHVEEQVHVALRRAPVDERRTERDAACPARRTDVNATIFEHLRTELEVEVVERVFGHIRRPIAEADDVERYVRQKFELVRRTDLLSQSLCMLEVPLDERAVPGASVCGECRPD